MSANAETIVECTACGAANALPDEARAVGRFECHACGAVQPVPPELPERLERRRPVEQPLTHEETVQTGPSYTPSAHNTSEALRRAEQEAGRFGCLVGLVAWLR